MSETAYNGWEGNGTRASAYATWRVMLEIVSDMQDEIRSEWYDEKPEERDLADRIKDCVEEIVCSSVEDDDAEKLATQYALAFLDDVSWDEIAENILSDWED